MNFFLIFLLSFSLLGTACAGKDHPEPAVPDLHSSAPAGTPASVAGCKKCIILAEQQQQRIAIADAASQSIVWEWKPANSNVKPEHVKWFSNVSDVKPVYEGKYLLVTASGGGVALVRISDKKTMFYAYAGGNTHSAELLPDGNIVSASSTGNYLTVFKTDTLNFPDQVYKKTIPIEFGHNVVWDKKNQLLWSAAMNKLKAFRYNFDCSHPDLTLAETIDLPGTGAHDLFPVYNENALWLTNTGNVYKFDVGSRTLTKADFTQPNIKSVSSGPAGLPVIVIKPNESWWTDVVLDSKGNQVFYQSGLKIYKARWLLPNMFSYPEDNSFKLCK